ncbi:MAG: SDR family NAD(P)-dependent oxidoreductase, partial [Bacteroidota bacterium]
VESPASPSPTAPATTNTGLSTAAIQETLLAVIAEKTGYPAEMLELGMDMEADLGIDSIKRVEIFGAMTSANPDIQGVNPQELAELRTLQQIVDYIAGKAGAVEGVVKKKSDALGETLGKPSATHFQHRAYPNVPRVEAFLQYLPQPDQLDWPRAADDTALVVSDGTHCTPTLIQSLAATGYRVICLQLPVTLVPQREASFPAGTQLIQLADTEESTLQRCLAELAGEVRHVFHLHPHLRFPLGKLGLQFDREKAIIKAIFLLAKLLKPTLNKNASQGRCRFCCITRMDGAMGRQNPGTVAIGGGAFFGLTKSLNLEWPKVFCRSIDLAPQLDTSVGAEAVLAEWRDADRRLTEIAYAADGKRYTLATRPSADLGATPLNAPITTESVFLVTGGAKGITADCVRAMAETFRCKFILVGRSALGTEPSWAQDQEAGTVLKRSAMRALQAAGEKPLPRTVQRMVNAVQSQREIRQTLSDVQAMGAEVHYLSADVTDALALRTALEPLVSQTGPITGILHGAGRLADKLIENKTAADFDAVYDVKIQGLLAVTQAIDIERIQQVVLFSSVAGFYGNVGQTDYAIANEILNRAAFLFQQNHPDTQVVSINWGAWDAGMVSPALKKVFEAHGVSLVPSEEGPWALVDQLSEQLAGQTQVILGGTLPLARAATDDPLQKHTMHRELRELANPFLRHHVIQDNAVLPIIHASNWMAQAAVDFYPGFHLSRVAEAKLFKGIVFDGRQAERYQLELVEQEKSEERIVVGVKISSRGSARLPINHYGALVTLQKEAPTAPVLPLPTSNGQAPFLDDASAVYTNGTLFHGSDFQGVQQILRLDRKGLLLRCEHPGVERERQGQFPVKSVNPYLTDIMYQSLLIWVREFHHCASLPLRTEWVEVFAALPFGRPFYVALEVVEANDFGMEADITAYDAQSGRVYLKSHRAGVTISKELQW